MTPPRSADAGTATIPSTDASVPADAAVTADASAPADASVSTDASAAPDAGSGPNPNPFRLRIAVEGGPTFLDMSNNAGLDHSGGYGRAEVGMEFRPNRGDSVFVQANAGLDLAWLSRGLGMGVNSSLNYQGILLNGRLGYSLLGGNLRLSAGVDLGAVHVGAPECRDGMSCGALFTRNPQLLPIDSWGFLIRPEVGISTLQGALGLFFRGGWMMGVNPAFNVVDGPSSSLNFGLNPAGIEVGIQVDVMSLIGLFTGGSRTSTARPAAPEGHGSGGSAEAPNPPPASEGNPTPPPALTGIALVRDLRQHANTLHTEANTEAEQAATARAAFTAITATDEAAMRRRRVQALEVYNQAMAVIEDYNGLGELLTQAQTTASGLTGADRTAANRIVQEITNWQTESRRLATQAYRLARQTVEEFNGLSGHGEDIAFSLVDPTPVSGGATPTRRRRTRTDTPRTDTPRTDAPRTDAPRTDAPRTDAPRTDAPRTDAPRTDAPRTDAPRSGADAGVPHTDAPRTGADAGAPVFIFGGGRGGGTTTGGADAGVPTRRRPDE
ncbi:MAG: hypothetical protein U1F66_08285 [bacterium]